MTLKAKYKVTYAVPEYEKNAPKNQKSMELMQSTEIGTWPIVRDN